MMPYYHLLWLLPLTASVCFVLFALIYANKDR